MGLPSGVMWSPVNIDVGRPGGFAESPFQYDCSFFSWGNIDGHNPTSPSSFSPWSWGAINSQAPWYDNQVYGSTPGATLNGDIPVGEEYDAARANLGAPWRMPTSEEFKELFDNVIYINADGSEVDTSKTDKRVRVNSILGLYIQSKINGARLFFPCSGNGTGMSRGYRGSFGGYWSSTWTNDQNGRCLRFNNSGVITRNINFRYYGYAVRPVMEL